MTCTGVICAITGTASAIIATMLRRETILMDVLLKVLIE